jgi:aspartyl-tRNA(Asn)/glutamyl-tRNA(Gln) amidotransferase subunit A
MMELHELTVTQAASMIRRREISPVKLLEALLQRIDKLEPAIKAWKTLDRRGALEAVQRAEKEVLGDIGPLHGVPIGVKDVIFVAGLPNTNDSIIFEKFIPSYDATCVARLRRAGAIMLGKTRTVQFAFSDPTETRNPWNRTVTPGGSSSGSGAAVAARMVPAALGTQTGGSVLRPAAYCGAVGLKPTYGRISRYGVTPNTWTVDTMGVIVRTVEDAALMLQVMAGKDDRDPSSVDLRVPDYLHAVRRKKKAPRLGLVKELLDRAQPAVAAHVREVVARFERAGAQIQEVKLPLPLPEITAIRNTIGDVEMTNIHGRLCREQPEGYKPVIKARVQVGQLIPGMYYIQAQRIRRRLRPQMERLLSEVDCLVMPTASNLPPDPKTTGDSSFQGLWTLFGFPSMSLPSGLSTDRLPFATQLVAPHFREDKLLGFAAWCEEVLGPMPSPPAT